MADGPADERRGVGAGTDTDPEAAPSGENEDSDTNNAKQQTAAGAGATGGAAENKVKRQQWGNDMQFLLSSIGYGVGFGNVWRFPYLVYRYGGGAFLIPFVFFLVTVALPLMLLESTVAQYAGMGPLHIYSAMCPGLKGCGLTAIYIAYVNSVQYILILAYVVRYTATSFTRRLPWTECDPTYSHDGCYGRCRGEDPEQMFVVIGRTCQPASQFCTTEGTRVTCTGSDGQQLVVQDPAFSFFYDRVLSMRHDDGTIATFPRFGYLVPTVFGSLFISYVITALVLEQGVATAGKVVYFTATFPYVGLTILLIRSAMLPGFANGVKFYLVPDISKLWSFEVWYQALSQTFFSLGVGFGGLMTLSSYNKFHTPIWRMCMFNACINLFTSILAGLVIFGSLGYIAHVSGQAIEDVAGSGISLTFVTFPTTLSLLPAAPVWAVIFFVMLITVGIDTQMGDMETQITAMLDNFVWMRKYKSFVTFGLALAGLTVASSMCFQGGFWLNALLNDYAATAPVLILAMGNVLAFAYLYGSNTIMDHLQEMIGPLTRWNKMYMKITWKYVAPAFTIFLLIYFFVDFPGSMYDKPMEARPYEPWVQWVGVAMAAVPIIFIPLGFFHEFYQARKKFPDMGTRDVLRHLVRPSNTFQSQKHWEEVKRISFLEFIQPTHQTEYVVPSTVGSQRASSAKAEKDRPQRAAASADGQPGAGTNTTTANTNTASTT